MHILFLFLDGIGLGEDDPAINPFAIAQMPHLHALQEQYDDQGLVVLSVSDRVDDAARTKMRELMAQQGARYPALIDPTGEVLRNYGVNTYPTLVLIDRGGTVRFTHTGFSQGDEATVAQHIEALLAED